MVPARCGPNTAGSNKKNANSPYSTSWASPRPGGLCSSGDRDTPRCDTAHNMANATNQLTQGMVGCHSQRGMARRWASQLLTTARNIPNANRSKHCLLYTSDAADDLTRVDLGG